MRGGDRDNTLTILSRPGRSPHARGRPCSGWCPRRHTGSIPACAGETDVDTGCGGPYKVDPRMRGGDEQIDKQLRTLLGRSPHARGRRLRVVDGTKARGSIPACAGETRPAVTVMALYRVDPRMRGGDTCAPTACRSTMGRSPHARGRHGCHAGTLRWWGSIPACAGET